MDIYIGNLIYNLEEEQIRKLFEVFGQVDKVTLLRDKQTGRSKGKAFVVMPDKINASTAIRELNGRSIVGRFIRVFYAHSNQGMEIEYTKKALNNLVDDLKEEISFKKEYAEKSSNQKTVTSDGYVKVKFS